VEKVISCPKEYESGKELYIDIPCPDGGVVERVPQRYLHGHDNHYEEHQETGNSSQPLVAAINGISQTLDLPQHNVSFL
jgi:hypothetical protein